MSNKSPRQSAGDSRAIITTDNDNVDTASVIPLAESDGTLKVSQYGKDHDDTVTAIPVDTLVQLDPVLVPAVEGALLDGSASLVSGGVYKVTFVIVNIDGSAAVTVDIGVDIAAGGSLSGAEYYMKDVVVPAGGNTGQHTLMMGADDDIRGVASVANDAAIHFVEVRRVA